MASDLPPQTVTINNTDQKGGTNVGILNIFNQTQPREVSKEQSEKLRELALGTPKLTIYFTIDTQVPDARKYAQSLAIALAHAGYDIFPDPEFLSMTPPQEDIGVTSDPSVNAGKDIFLNILRGAGIKVAAPAKGWIAMGVAPAAPQKPRPPGIRITVGIPSQ